MWTAIDAPLNSAGIAGAEADAPAALRKAGLLEALGAAGGGESVPRLEDSKRDPETGIIAFADLQRATEALRTVVSACIERGERPLVVGGDCSLLPGAFAGARDSVGRVGLWFVDGHPDFLDGDTSPTGEAADMELAMLTGHGTDRLGRDAAGAPLVREEDVVILGHRPPELGADVAIELGRVPAAIARKTAGEVLAEGAERVARSWERELAARGPVWLHLDVDALDARALPAVSYPQLEGLDWEAFETLARVFLASDALAGLSIADYNPDLDPDGRYARRVVEALSRAGS